MNFTLHLKDFFPLMPVIIVALTAIIVMILTAIKRSHHIIATVSVVGLNIALVYLVVHGLNLEDGFINPNIMNLFMVDSFTQLYQIMILIAALACCTLSHAYIEGYNDHKEEVYILMLFSVVGAMLMVASSHYASFFISLELMSIPVYGMLAYTYQRSKSLEAGIKYLVLSATASAMLLMGMAFVYAYTGTLSFYEINQQGVPALLLVLQHIEQHPFVIVGLAMIVFAVAFKLSLAPFHKWTPDVYNGAPAPIATFLATVAKVATIGLFIRYLLSSGIILIPSIQVLMIVLAVASIIVGNLLALRQQNLKRILGYSSIAHFGYLLLAPLSIMHDSQTSVTMYIFTYVLTTIGAFGVVTLMSSPYSKLDDSENLDLYRGIFWKHPILTATLTVMMLSLAGIPLTAGFIAKFLIVKDIVNGNSWFLAIMLIIGSGIGLYYYLRVIITLYKKPETTTAEPIQFWGQKAGGIVVFISAILVFLVGVYPDPIISLIDSINIVSPLHDYLIHLSQNAGAESLPMPTAEAK